MTITLEQVRNLLTAEEPDYRSAIELWGEEVLAHLPALLNDENVGVAAAAVSLASHFKNEASAQILKEAIKHNDPIVRIAATSGARRLPEETAAKILSKALKDKDFGVRRRGLKTLEVRPLSALRTDIDKLAKSDDIADNRKLAKRILTALNR